jgi:WD40 repeat protein
MNPEERRLSDLLHRVAPEPPRRVNVEDVAFRLANTAGQGRARSPRSRPGFQLLGRLGWAPALAAASVVAVAGLSAGAAVVLTSHHGSTSGTPNLVNPTTSAPQQTSAAPTQSATSTPPVRGAVAIPDGPWAAELLDGGHQTLNQGSLVGSGGSLYAYTDGYLVRLDPVTGSVLARTPFSPAVPNPPVIVGNTVWTVLGYSGGNVTLRAFDATTLAEVRTVLVPAYGQVSSNGQGVLASGPDGHLYVAAGRSVAVMDSPSGQVLQQRIDLTAGTAGSVAVSPDGSKLYIGVGSFQLLVYDLGSDTEVGSSTMNIGGSGGNLVATSGGVWGTIGVGMSEWVWFAPDGNLRFAHRESTGAGAGFDSLPSYSGGVVWIGGSHTMECASPVNGQALATALIPADNGVVQYFGSPTVTGGHAYAYYQDSSSQQMGLARMTPPPACGLTTSTQGS